ncbi:hypothetical protein Emed_002559 [Eimeria media]
MDEARQAADLPKLTKQSLFPAVQEQDDQNTYLKSICDTLLGEQATDAKAGETSKGTLATYRLADNTNPDCTAAVKDWQGGFSIFEENPPVEADTGNYSNLDEKARSFVALYNPSDPSIKGDCQKIVCQQTTTNKQKETVQNNNATDKTASALVCLTSPDAFTKNPLYSQQQWEKIAKALTNSTSIAMPTSLALAAVLTGVMLL